jgi:predicted Zn-dependent protease
VVKELAQPLFSAAGIDSDRIKVFIINDNSINAFVAHFHYVMSLAAIFGAALWCLTH